MNAVQQKLFYVKCELVSLLSWCNNNNNEKKKKKKKKFVLSRTFLITHRCLSKNRMNKTIRDNTEEEIACETGNKAGEEEHSFLLVVGSFDDVTF